MGGLWPQQVSGGLMKPAKAWGPGTAQGGRPCASDLKLALPFLTAGAWEKGGSSLLEESPGKVTLPTAMTAGVGAPEGEGPRSLFVHSGLLSNQGGPASR